MQPRLISMRLGFFSFFVVVDEAGTCCCGERITNHQCCSLSLSVTAFLFVPLASIDQSDFFLFEHEMDQLL